MTDIALESLIVLVLSILCGVLGVFLLLHKGIRMMKGGLLHRVSIGIAVIGIILGLHATSNLFSVEQPWSDFLLVAVLITLFFIGYSVWSSANEMSA